MKKTLVVLFGIQIVCSSFAMEEEKSKRPRAKISETAIQEVMDRGTRRELQEVPEGQNNGHYSFVYEDIENAIRDQASQPKPQEKEYADEKERMFDKLCKAAHDCDAQGVGELIEKGAPVEYNENSALFSVIKGFQGRSYCIVELNGNKEGGIQEHAKKAKTTLLTLIEAGADVNKKNKECETPLMRAAFYALKGLVKLLLKAKADKEMVNKEIGGSAWYYADEVSEGYPLKFYAATMDPYYQIAFSYPEYKLYRQKCIDLLRPTENSPLFEQYCARQKVLEKREKLEQLCNATNKLDINAVKQILETGVSLTEGEQSSFYYPLTMTLWLAVNGFIQSVSEVRIDKSIKKEAIVKTIAELRERTKIIIEQLVKNGFDINAKNFDGQTAFMLALSSANKPLVKKFLELNARTDIKDNDGYTASDYAQLDSAVVKINLKKKRMFHRFVENYCHAHMGDQVTEEINYFAPEDSGQDAETTALWGVEVNYSIKNMIYYKKRLEKVHSLLTKKAQLE